MRLILKHLRNVLSFLSAHGLCYTKYMKGGRKRKLTRRREEQGETAGKQYFLRMWMCVFVVGWHGDRYHRPSAVDGIWDSLLTSTDIQKPMYRWLPLRVCEELCPVLNMSDSKYTLTNSVCHVHSITAAWITEPLECLWCKCDFWRTHQSHNLLF